MSLEGGNLGVFDRLEACVVEIIFLQPAAELLEGSAAHAKHGKSFGDGIVVPEVYFGVKVLFIFLGRILLVEPRKTQVSII